MTSALAIEGGEPTVGASDITAWCPVSDADRDAVQRVLDGGVLAGDRAPETVALQQEWAAYLGARYAILTNSGTAALHMALAAVGVRAGDEVVVPAYTFVASATAALHHNAIPVFADVDPATWCIDPAEFERRISSRTRAVVVVHLNGQPAAMGPIGEIARRHGVAVVEDACQAHGSRAGGVSAGRLGVAAAFSLNKTKSLPAGEGGLFVTDDREIYEAARALAKFGEIYDSEGTRSYDAYGMGWMYRSTELTAAIARARLHLLDGWSAERMANREELDSRLEGVAGLRVMRPVPATAPVPWRYALRLAPEDFGLELTPDFRTCVVNALEAEGVPTDHWQRMVVPEQTLFRRREGYGGGCPWSCSGSAVTYEPGSFPVASDAVNRSVWISQGVQPGNGSRTIGRIADAVRKVMEGVPRLVSSGG